MDVERCILCCRDDENYQCSLPYMKINATNTQTPRRPLPHYPQEKKIWMRSKICNPYLANFVLSLTLRSNKQGT